MIKFGLVATVFAISLSATQVLAQSVAEDALWCLDQKQDRRLFEMGFAGNCATFQALAAAGVYFGNASSLVLTTRQYDWGRTAAEYSCRGDDISRQIAIRLIQVCQCHNTAVVDRVENNQNDVIAALRSTRCP